MPKQSILIIYSIGSTIAQCCFAIQATDKAELQQFFSQHKNSNRSKRKRPVIQLKVHASIFDIIKNNSRQRNTLKGLFSLEIDVIKVPEGKPDVFQAPTS